VLADCEELTLASDETIANISLRYSASKGLNMIGVLTNKENSLVKGLKVESDETKTLRFNQSYQLIGFKGLGSADSLDSLGAIMFDTTCDVNNPQGAKLRVPSLDAFEVSPAKE